MTEKGQTRISVWIGYLATIAIELVLTRLLIGVHQLLPLGQYPIYYVLVIMLVAYVFGEGPAILAFFLGLLAFDYFFVPPLRTVLPHAETPAAWASLIAYLMGTFIVGFATVMIRRSKRRVQRTTRKLRESEEDLNRAQAVAHTGSWRLDVRHNELLWSDENHRIFGIPKGTPMTYETFLSTVHSDDREYVDQKWTAAMSGAPYDIEHRIVVDGDVRWVRERAELEFNEEGVLLGGFGTTQDITDRKKAEEERERLLAEIEHRAAELDATFDSMAAGLSITSADGPVLRMNVMAEQILGLRADEFSGSISERMHQLHMTKPDGTPFALEETPTYRASHGETVLGLTEVLRFPDRTVWLSVNAAPMLTSNGKQLGVVTTFTDITARVQAEEALRESEERFRFLFENMTERVTINELVYDDQGNVVDWIYRERNPACDIATGIPHGSAIGRRMTEVHGLDHPPQPFLDEYSRVAKTGESVRFEAFFAPLDEYYLVSAFPAGQGRVASVTTDITQLKKAEEALETARKAAEYGKSRLEAVLEALPVGMAITDAKGGFIMVNKAFEQVWSGHPTTKSVKDYAAYKGWWVDTGKPVAPEEWASAQAVQRGKAVVGQLVEIQRFDGSHAFILNSASPIRDADGNIIGSAVAIQDITEHRRAEDALREVQEHKLEFYQRTILAATDGKLVITERAEIEKLAGPAEASWEISKPADVAIIRHGIQEIAQSMGLEEPRSGQLTVAVGEASTNALKHAKEGEASAHKTENGLLVVISDRGPGIPALALPDVALTHGYSTAGTLGMGYKLMISFADKVYLATGAEGTTAGIEMRIGL